MFSTSLIRNACIRASILGTCLLAVSSVGAAEGPRMSLSLSPEEIRVGEEARLDVAVTWKGRGERYRDCRLDAPKLVNGRMVGNAVETKVRLEEGKPRTEWHSTFRFRPEVAGPGRIGPVEFSFRDGASSAPGDGTTTAPPFFLSGAALDFRVEPGGWSRIRLEGKSLAAAGGLVLLACLVAFGLGRRAGRGDHARVLAARRRAEEEREAAKGPFSEDELQRMRMEGEGRAFFALLRDELIDGLCRARGLERVGSWGDEALVEALGGAGLAPAEARSLRGFLDDCTRVRFGGERPGGETMDEALRRARSLVAAAGSSDEGRRS